MQPPTPWPPGGPSPAPTALWLPRVQLDALLHQALAGPPREVPRTLLAHAPLVLQPDPTGPVALAGLLNTEPLRALPAQRAGDPGRVPQHGLLLVAVSPAGTVLPAGDAAWEAWLLRTAPGFRLATTALNPSVLVLWLRLDGQGALMHRHGVLPQATGLGPGHAPARWVPVPQLHLPGGGMARVEFAAAPGVPATLHTPIAEPAAAPAAWRSPDAPHPPDPDDGDSADSRYSRQAAAFGAAALQQLQRSRIVLVGAGRVGSVLAHGLVRLGVQQLTVIEPDHMEPHNADGDVAPLLEGRPKVEALQRFLRGLHRPGAVLDLLPLPIAHPTAGARVAQADAVLVCVDNDAARLWATAWALAHNRCLLAVATGVREQGAELDLRLLPAGSGCLACTGGYAQAAELLQQLASEGAAPTPADFRQQRRGSLRSWSAMAAHMAQRLLEQHLLRPGGGALFRQVAETPQGGLQVRDWRPEGSARLRACPFCRSLQGAGPAAVTPHRLRALTAGWLAGTAARAAEAA